jgi:hypothetical protein
MCKSGFKRELSLLKNESGAVMISNAIVSSLMVVILVLFGETVTTCYQYISLQHALNEGLRVGILPKPANDLRTLEAYRKVKAEEKVYNVATNLKVNNNNISNTGFQRKSSFVSGQVLVPTVIVQAYNPLTPERNKWVEVRIRKRLDFSKVLSLISGSSANRSFNFDFRARAKIKTN